MSNGNKKLYSSIPYQEIFKLNSIKYISGFYLWKYINEKQDQVNKPKLINSV